MNPSDHDSYYVYSGSIFKVDRMTKKLRLRDRQTGQWQEIPDPVIWNRIQVEGDSVSKEEAERLFHIFRSKQP